MYKIKNKTQNTNLPVRIGQVDRRFFLAAVETNQDYGKQLNSAPSDENGRRLGGLAHHVHIEP